MIGLLVFTALFAAAFYYFQVFAWYQPAELAALPVAGAQVALADYQGIDAVSSPLKLRGCFRADPAAFAAAERAPQAEPLLAPFWFRCFDARTIAQDLAAGGATGYRIEADAPVGFDLMAAIYPDGRGYLWRQLNQRWR